MKLLILTSSFPRWEGDISGRFMEGYARALALAGLNVTVLAPLFPGAAQEEEKAPGIRVIRFPCPPLSRFLPYGSGMLANLSKRPYLFFGVPGFLFSFYRYASHLIRHADLLDAHWAVPAGLVAARLKQKTRIPFLLTLHSGDVFFLSRMPAGKAVLSFILQKADHVYSSSKKVLEAARMAWEPPLDSIRVLPMGYDPAEIPEKKALLGKELRLLFMGRMERVKGVQIIPGAVEGLPVELLFAGEGSLRRALEKECEKKGIAARFFGAVFGKEKREVLGLADVALFPSLAEGQEEGCPVSLLEALASGVPVIASRNGGIPEIVRDGRNGFLVEPGSKKGLREGVRRFLLDPPILPSMLTEARRSVRGLSLGEVVSDRILSMKRILGAEVCPSFFS